MLRDFSDNALNEIKNRYSNSIMQVRFSPAALMAANDAYAFRYDGYAAADQEQGKKAEYYDGITASLDSIFKKVRDYDIQAKASCAADVGRCEQLDSVVRSLRDIINPYPQSGVCALTLPAAELAQKLSANDNALMQIVVSRMMTLDDNGNPVYDWDEIERVMQQPADEITLMEYYVLAYLYSQMSEDDMERFLQRLAEPGESHNTSDPAVGISKLPTWTFDKAKSDKLTAALILAYANQNRSFDPDSQTRLAILQVLPSLGMNPSDLADGHGLTAPDGARYPRIDITFCPGPSGGATIDYSYIGSQLNENRGINFSPTEAQCMLLPPTFAANALKDWNSLLDEAQKEFFGVDQGDVAGLGLGILAIPLAFTGPIALSAGLAVSAAGVTLSITGIIERQKESGDITEGLDQSTLLGQVYGQFGCSAVIASDTESSTEHQLFIYPGRHTDGIINNLNSALASNPDAIGAAAALGYPVTYEAIISDPAAASELMSNLGKNHPEIYDDVFNSASTSGDD